MENPVHCGELNFQTGPIICCLLNMTCTLDWFTCDGYRQGLLRLLDPQLPNRCPYLLEAGRVGYRPKLHWPLSAATRCPVMTQDAVYFSGAVSVGYGRASCACFTARRETPLSDAPSTNPSKRAGNKVSHKAFSTGTKASPIPGVTRSTIAHS